MVRAPCFFAGQGTKILQASVWPNNSGGNGAGQRDVCRGNNMALDL